MNVDLCQFNSVYIIEEVLVKYIFTLHITVPMQSKWTFWSITYTAVKAVWPWAEMRMEYHGNDTRMHESCMFCSTTRESV